tara:strand:+ start:557 stop:712 length:156 start_codon:yes stop_codon:yes gene_type:complete
MKKAKEMDLSEIELEEVLEVLESYRKKVRSMLDLNADGQEEESDYKPHERA